MRHLLLWLCFLFCSPAFGQDLSIETVLSSPFPSDGVASNSVDKAAWVINDRGHYNVWIAEGPSYQLRQLTQYSEDDGQAISDLEISRSGDWIAYVRGGFANAAKEIPNPSSNPRGAKQQVWMIRSTGGKPIFIGEGFDPQISPNGKTIIYVRDSQIYQAAVDQSVQESILFQARGNQRFSSMVTRWLESFIHQSSRRSLFCWHLRSCGRENHLDFSLCRSRLRSGLVAERKTDSFPAISRRAWANH